MMLAETSSLPQAEEIRRLSNPALEHPADLCIYHLLASWAELAPDAIAIAAPGRTPLTYSRLLSHVDDVVKMLNVMGVGCNDRVAMVLPNGPEMAAAFIAVAAGATCAPLNPAYRESEFDFYISDLKAKALVVQSGEDSTAIAIAQKHSIPIIELSPAVETDAGIFSLRGERQQALSRGGFAQAEDVALILYTSGTTSRPKMVALTHSNLLASARNIKATLQLTEKDRSLNVMPLFHIHGLVGAILSSVMAGASIVCTSGFDSEKFFAWIQQFCPTWYTAVPTIHQAILSCAQVYRETIRQYPLRFIRSSSAALPPRVMQELEEIFYSPVIEAYGMTEASHQIASNPLPPGTRKARSVGLPAGVEVAVMDDQGNVLSSGEAGEILIRGANVTSGYANSPAANKENFRDGWFRTGDQGYLDRDGYLFITGRLNETINRGGEKISPREVDEVLINHPAVAQAVTFPLPHTKLGEDVAAAIVLHKNASATEREIQEFAATGLADFKVPRRVVIVDEIPKSATGKQQRIGLAEKLGLTASDHAEPGVKAEFAAPSTPVEEMLAKIWSQILGIEQVGIHDNFFDLGGHSLLATKVISRLREAFQIELPLRALFENPTIEELAKMLTERGHEMAEQEKLSRLVAELEALSDEEAQQLFARNMPQRQ